MEALNVDLSTLEQHEILRNVVHGGGFYILITAHGFLVACYMKIHQGLINTGIVVMNSEPEAKLPTALHKVTSHKKTTSDKSL